MTIRATMAAVALVASLLLAGCGEDNGDAGSAGTSGVDPVVSTPTVTGLERTPGAPRDQASPPAETVTPPPELQLQTQVEEAVEELRGAITEVRLELDRVTLQTNLEETAVDVAEQACEAVLEVQELAEFREFTIITQDGTTIASCAR